MAIDVIRDYIYNHIWSTQNTLDVRLANHHNT